MNVNQPGLQIVSNIQSTGSFQLERVTDKTELQELVTLDKRLEGLLLSCARLSIDFRDQASWTALLADFSAFTASCNLTTSAVLPKFYTRSLAPDHLALDPSVFSEVPTLLSTKPDDAVAFAWSQFKKRLEEEPNKVSMDWGRTPFAEARIRRRIKEQNNCLEQASRRIAADTTRPTFNRKSQLDLAAGKYLTTAYQIEQERSTDHIISLISSVLCRSN